MRFLARSLGLIMVAAGFVGLVIDGTRSIVNNTLSFGTVEGTINALVPGGLAGLQQRASARVPGAVWDFVFVHLMQLPASVTAFFIGAFLLWLGQKSLEPVGHLAGR